MTTSNSPLAALRAQASTIATLLKRAELYGSGTPAALLKARNKPTVKVGIVMDDKVLTPEIEWATIAGLTHDELVNWIVGQMRGDDSIRG